MTEPLQWYVLRVRANFEQKVAASLSQRGIEPFLPCYKCRSYWSDRVKWVEKPLFPGYVFCRFDANKRLPVMQAPGVVDAVNFGGKLAPVDPVEIDRLISLTRSALPMFPRAFLAAGQKVVITRGPLTGLEGVLERFEKECRIVVSVTLLQRSVCATIDAEWVNAF